MAPPYWAPAQQRIASRCVRGTNVSYTAGFGSPAIAQAARNV
jgi:hypothetical protein